MSGYLRNLVARTIGAAPVVRPRMKPLFAPVETRAQRRERRPVPLRKPAPRPATQAPVTRTALSERQPAERELGFGEDETRPLVEPPDTPIPPDAPAVGLAGVVDLRETLEEGSARASPPAPLASQLRLPPRDAVTAGLSERQPSGDCEPSGAVLHDASDAAVATSSEVSDLPNAKRPLGVRAHSHRVVAGAEPSLSALLTGAALHGEVAALARREDVASSAESPDEERLELPHEPALEHPLVPLARELHRYTADHSEGRPPRDHRTRDATTSGTETRSDATTVHVTIGRVEVRAPQTADPKPAIQTSTKPRTTLDEYLRARMKSRR